MSYIGLDIGGSNVRFAVANDWNLNNLEYRKKPFIRSGNPQNEVEENICSIIDAVSDCVEGLSISLAAVMDRSRKKVKTWPNNPSWNHYDLVQHLSSRYNVPIVIEDDANCGAICEYHLLKDSVRNMAYITIGTGIGCGLILNGSLFTGENGFAGELGHIYIGYASNDSMCSCGNQSCFQAVASGPAVLRKYNSAAKTCLTSLEQVHRKYLHGDPIAVKCLSDMIDCISGVIYNLAMCLDIPLFIMGGGVSNMGTDLISQIESKANERLKFFERRISVKQAHLGEFSGVYGALQLLKNHVLMGKGE
jgi:glucokinase